MPVINELSKGCHPTDAVNAVIMAPTRELAQQIDQQIQGFTYFIPSVSAVARVWRYRRNRLGTTKERFRDGCGYRDRYPGRLLSHIKLGTVDLSKVSFFVLRRGGSHAGYGFL